MKKGIGELVKEGGEAKRERYKEKKRQAVIYIYITPKMTKKYMNYKYTLIKINFFKWKTQKYKGSLRTIMNFMPTNWKNSKKGKNF